MTGHNMRLMQAEQFIFHSRKYSKFGLRFLPLAVIENALPALISNTLPETLWRQRKHLTDGHETNIFTY